MQKDSPAYLSKKTLQLDLIRAPAEGIMRALVQTLALMIAIEYYQINDIQKSILSAGTHVGFLLCPIAILLIQKYQFKSNYILGSLQAFSTILLFALFFKCNATIFVYTVSFLFIISSFRPFLMTNIYQANYAAKSRGKLFSIQLVIVTIFNLIAIYYIGNIRSSLTTPAFMILIFASASFIISIIFFNYPIKVAKKKDVNFKFFAILKNDKLFLRILIIWFIFGFANLSTIPLRTAYIMEEKYGFNYSFEQASLILGLIPTISQLIFLPIMGRAFDRYNFIKVRIVLNIMILFSIVSFFMIGAYWGFILGGILHGSVLAGGNIAWNLWVTKIAKPENTSNYMVVHQFFTGVRGVSGPAVAFSISALFGVFWTASLSALLVVVSITMLIPLLKKGGKLNNA